MLTSFLQRPCSPGTMHVDYVRVWQEKGKTDVSCDPKDHPTAKYIDKYMEYYTNRAYIQS